MPVKGPRWDVGELERSPLPLTYPCIVDVVREAVSLLGLGTACGLLLLCVVLVVAIALNHKDDNADTHQ